MITENTNGSVKIKLSCKKLTNLPKDLKILIIVWYVQTRGTS
jgi:hypothetical protein